MTAIDWSRTEVEAIIDDYLSMLASELAGTPYNKTAHRRALQPLLRNRSDQSIEFKHANISAALLDAGFPYISGYKPRSNYQSLLAEVLSERLRDAKSLTEIAASDADRPMAVPEVDDILAILVQPPVTTKNTEQVAEAHAPYRPIVTNYLEREARNRSLGDAGEHFILNYERARLIHLGRDSLAAKVEHTAKEKGDHEGFDILSFEENGAERLIEVKTTKYGSETPFFVTRNEVQTSTKHHAQYHLYRLFDFRRTPRLYTLNGAIERTCLLSPETYFARPR